LAVKFRALRSQLASAHGRGPFICTSITNSVFPHTSASSTAPIRRPRSLKYAPWAMGRRAWLFAGSELAGQRAAIVMSLVQSARPNGHEPRAYLRDVLAWLPTQLNSRIEELLPHRSQPSATR
jgi:hypothetical protein